MASESTDKWELARKFLGLLTKEEVKTPLSFYFKAAGYFTASLVIILYSPIPDEMKYRLTIIAALVLLIVCGIVTVFGWFRPKHLVYGEAGHRAERKMDFGTEKKSYSREQYELLESVKDTKQLTGKEE